MSISPGDFITMRNVRRVFDNGYGDYKAPRGYRFVFAFLGVTKDDGSDPFDGEAALNRLGWFFREDDTLPHPSPNIPGAAAVDEAEAA